MSDAEQEAEGLARFGIAARSVLREPTRDRHEPMNVCAECGAPAEGPSTFLAHHPTLVGEIEVDILPVYGWRCDRHSYEVVMPLRIDDPRAPSEGWTGVLVQLADGREREIAVPAAEVEHDE